MFRPTNVFDLFGHDPTYQRSDMPTDKALKHCGGFVTRRLPQQTTIFHGGIPNGANRCLENLTRTTVRLSRGERTRFKI